MTDDEIGKNFFVYTNRGWSKPTPWENLGKPTQQLWIERAKREAAKYKNKEGE